MYSRDDYQEKLKNDTKDLIFNRQLEEKIALRRKEKEDVEKTYAEKVDRSKYAMQPSLERLQRFKVEGDDKFFSK